MHTHIVGRKTATYTGQPFSVSIGTESCDWSFSDAYLDSAHQSISSGLDWGSWGSTSSKYPRKSADRALLRGTSQKTTLTFERTISRLFRFRFREVGKQYGVPENWQEELKLPLPDVSPFVQPHEVFRRPSSADPAHKNLRDANRILKSWFSWGDRLLLACKASKD